MRLNILFMNAKGPWALTRGGTVQAPCNSYYMQRLTILDALTATEEAIWSCSDPQKVELGRKLCPLTGQGHFLDTAGKEN